MANNKFIHLLLACTLFAACDDNDAPVDESKAYPAVIMAEAFDYGSETGTTWFKGETIGVYMLESGTDDIVAPYRNLRYYANPFDNQYYFLPGTNDSIPYFPATGETMDIAAYYPRATVLADSLVAIHLIENYDYASQLLFARVSDLSKDSRKAELLLRPVLARLTFKFKVGYGMTEADLKGMSVTLQGLPVSGNFNATTGKIRFRDVTAGQNIRLVTTESSKKKAAMRTVTRAGSDKEEEDDDTFITAQGMVLPASTTEGYKVIIELPAAEGGSGKKYEYDIPESTDNFENSTEYIFNSKINDKNLSVVVNKSPITNWEPGGIINGNGEEKTK